MLSDWLELPARISCYVIEIDVKVPRVLWCMLACVCRQRKRKGMICDVLYLAASNVIESLSTKMFAVLEILLLPLFCIIVR